MHLKELARAADALCASLLRRSGKGTQGETEAWLSGGLVNVDEVDEERDSRETARMTPDTETTAGKCWNRAYNRAPVFSQCICAVDTYMLRYKCTSIYQS